MKALNKIVILAALVCVPSIARADFGSRSHGDHCNSSWNSNYGNYGHYNYGYNNSGFGWRPQDSSGYGFGHYPRPRDYNYNTGYGLSSYDNAIRNGVRSGQLSPREVNELRGDVREIREKEYEYRADGYLSPREQRDLRDEFQDLRKDLNHELNDGERRY